MKYTNREKILLGVLILAVLFYVEYTYVITGQLERIKTQSEINSGLQIQLDELKNAKDSEKKIQGDIDKGMKGIKEISDRNFITTEQEELILMINDLVTDSGVDVKSYSFPVPQETTIGGKSFKKVVATISFTSSFENLDKLLNRIWSFQKILVVDNVMLNKDESGILNGNLDIVCYYLPIIDGVDTKDNLYQIIPDDSFFKGNPFIATPGAGDFRLNYIFNGGQDPSEVAYTPYGDIKGHWAESVINDFGNSGYLPQIQEKTFGPDTPMTRGEFVVMLDRIYKWPKPEKPVDLKQFSDYASLGSYENSIAKAVFKGYLGGYVVGYSDNTLRPQDPLTYEELEYIVQKLKSQPGFKWEQIASKLKAEKNVDTKGSLNKKETVTKAESVYLMSVIK